MNETETQQYLQSTFPQFNIAHVQFDEIREVCKVHVREHQPNPDALRGLNLEMPLLPWGRYQPAVLQDKLKQALQPHLSTALPLYIGGSYPQKFVQLP